MPESKSVAESKSNTIDSVVQKFPDENTMIYDGEVFTAATAKADCKGCHFLSSEYYCLIQKLGMNRNYVPCEREDDRNIIWIKKEN